MVRLEPSDIITSVSANFVPAEEELGPGGYHIAIFSGSKLTLLSHKTTISPPEIVIKLQIGLYSQGMNENNLIQPPAWFREKKAQQVDLHIELDSSVDTKEVKLEVKGCSNEQQNLSFRCWTQESGKDLVLSGKVK